MVLHYRQYYAAAAAAVCYRTTTTTTLLLSYATDLLHLHNICSGAYSASWRLAIRTDLEPTKTEEFEWVSEWVSDISHLSLSLYDYVDNIAEKRNRNVLVEPLRRLVWSTSDRWTTLRAYRETSTPDRQGRDKKSNREGDIELWRYGDG